jgi:hypothetical protein
MWIGVGGSAKRFVSATTSCENVSMPRSAPHTVCAVTLATDTPAEISYDSSVSPGESGAS